MTGLNVKRIATWVPACESGRHTYHGGITCQEADNWIAHRDAWLEQHIGAAMGHALDGDHDAAMGVLLEPARVTPIERAIGILQPHLDQLPLYHPAARDR